MRRLLPFLALLCTATACTPQTATPAQPEGYTMDVYFVSQTITGPALVAEARTIDPEVDVMTQLIATVLTPPKSPDLTSPIPSGVALRSTELDEFGTLTVDLNERYGSLSGIDLTLADCAMALTLCQLPEVQSVIVTVDGEIIPFRDQQAISSADVILDFDSPGHIGTE